MPENGSEPVDKSLTGVDPADWFKTDKKPAGIDESKLLDAVKAIFSVENMSVKSVLEEKHMVALVRGLIFADKYKSKTMALLVQSLMEIRVSHKGRGRKDLIAALRAAISEPELHDNDSKNMRQRLFGG